MALASDSRRSASDDSSCELSESRSGSVAAASSAARRGSTSTACTTPSNRPCALSDEETVVDAGVAGVAGYDDDTEAAADAGADASRPSS